jgi:hypothetical protein
MLIDIRKLLKIKILIAIKQKLRRKVYKRKDLEWQFKKVL